MKTALEMTYSSICALIPLIQNHGDCMVEKHPQCHIHMESVPGKENKIQHEEHSHQWTGGGFTQAHCKLKNWRCCSCQPPAFLFSTGCLHSFSTGEWEEGGGGGGGEVDGKGHMGVGCVLLRVPGGSRGVRLHVLQRVKQEASERGNSNLQRYRVQSEVPRVANGLVQCILDALQLACVLFQKLPVLSELYLACYSWRSRNDTQKEVPNNCNYQALSLLEEPSSKASNCQPVPSMLAGCCGHVQTLPERPEGVMGELTRSQCHPDVVVVLFVCLFVCFCFFADYGVITVSRGK